MRPVRGEALAVGVAAIGGIEGAKARDEALVDGALRYLVGGVPAAVVGHGRDRIAVAVITLAVAQHAVEFAVVVRVIVRPVVVEGLDGVQQRTGADAIGIDHQAALVAVFADAEFGKPGSSSFKRLMRTVAAEAKSPSSAKYGPFL